MQTLEEASEDASELQIRVTTTGSHRWLVLDGDLDRHTAAAVRRCLDGFARERVVEVVVDLTLLRRFDDGGVAVLLETLDGGWQTTWRRPVGEVVADALSERLVTDFYLAIDSAMTRARVAERLVEELAQDPTDSAPRPTSVVWVARSSHRAETAG